MTFTLASTIAVALSSSQVPELTDKNYIAWQTYLAVRQDEATFDRVPWKLNLWDGVIEAQKSKKPILLWLGNGNPLGSTSANGMKLRRGFWDRVAVTPILSQVIPVADDYNRLRKLRDPEGDALRAAVHGDAAELDGALVLLAPTGRLCAFIGASAGESLRQESLTRSVNGWSTLPDSVKLRTDDPSVVLTLASRSIPPYPSDGLVLKIVSRDLPLRGPSTKPSGPWNLEYCWFRKNEVMSMVPHEIREGQSFAMPSNLCKRMIALHLVDNVCGPTDAYLLDKVQEDRVRFTVSKIQRGIATMRVYGSGFVSESGQWAVEPGGKPSKQVRGVDLQILGKAEFDTSRRAFRRFEFVALAKRWGGTQFNGRKSNLTSGQVGFYVSIAPNRPQDQVMPSHFWEYGWTPN